jgi:hypothetical protein
VCDSDLWSVVTRYKWSINRITNPNPVYSHSYTWQLVSEVVGLETAVRSYIATLGDGTNDGTPAGWAKNHMRTSERRNENQPRKTGRQPKGDDGRNEGLPRSSEACPESKKPTALESVAVYEKVPEEKAAVKTVSALKKRRGDQHLAVGHRREPQKRTQGDSGSQMNLAMSAEGCPPCPSCTAQGTRWLGTMQRQCCKRRP